MADRVVIGGIPVTVVSSAEAERCSFVICVRQADPTPFTDNVLTRCALCGTGIQHRPTAPVVPPKICLACAISPPVPQPGKVH